MRFIGRLIGGVIRLALLPFKVAAKIVFTTVAVATKITTKTLLLPVKATRTTTRLVGLKAFFFGAIGLAIGLLFAPMTGRQLREKLMAALAGGGTVPDDEVADKVAFELSHAPRTWHIEPQPDVTVLAGRVVLSGEVRDEHAAEEFARVAAAVPGVIAVDNQLKVTAEDAS